MNGDELRGTGRTYSMINLVADCIQDGQPMVVLIGHNGAFIEGYLIYMLIDQLKRRGLTVERWNMSRRELMVAGSTIRYMTSTRGFTQRLMGLSPCWFVDHACFDLNMVDPTDYEFLMSYPQRKCKWCDE